MRCPECDPAFGDWPEECVAERCTYYTHYLRYGPQEIPHAAYHAAEVSCNEMQRACERYLNQDRDVPAGLLRQVEKLEKEVRA
jgi:hypothetical protein